MDEPERPENGKTDVMRSCFVIIAVVAVVFALIFYAGNKAFEPKKTTPDLYEITRTTSLVFPVGSKVIHSYKEGWKDYELAAVVEMNPQDVKFFINSLPSNPDSKPEISRSDRLGITRSISRFTEELEWWNPDKAKKFTAIYTTDGRYLHVILDQDDPSRTVAYIYWYNT
ncbi:MAG: hypothetical protein ACYC27_23035 [Armatimonadota bacterium]